LMQTTGTTPPLGLMFQWIMATVLVCPYYVVAKRDGVSFPEWAPRVWEESPRVADICDFGERDMRLWVTVCVSFTPLWVHSDITQWCGSNPLGRGSGDLNGMTLLSHCVYL
jgi:hypothetical protein